MKILSVLGAMVFTLASFTNDDIVQLFNGKNLDNWEKILFEDGDPEKVFSVDEGVIRVSGKPNGYIVTKESYKNYKLHLEWRWPAEPSNSGVLLHVQELNKEEWPLCIEGQLMNGNAGDLVLIGHGSGISIADSDFLAMEGESRFEVRPGMEESSENPAGQWNSYDIICSGGEIVLQVNGIIQNIGHNATITEGRIALQSEGGPIEFRNVYLSPL